MPGVLRLLLAARPAPDTPLGARDRAMLLLGFGAALRRAELVALTIGDVAPVPGRGLLLTIARSKTDQHGAGQRVAVHANPAEPGCCPAAALEAWLRHRRTAPDLDWTASASMRAERPLFCAVTKAGTVTGQGLSDKAVVRLVKQAAAAAGLDAETFSGHSLRRGLLTAGADNRAQPRRTHAPVAPSLGAERARLSRAGGSVAQQRDRGGVSGAGAATRPRHARLTRPGWH